MSILLSQRYEESRSLRRDFLIEPFISGLSHYTRHNVAPYHTSADSHNRNGSHHPSIGHRFHNNSTNDGKNPIPLPDWPVALSRWGLFWDLHVYGFSALSLILTLFSAAIFLRFRLRVHGCKIVFNTLILSAASGIFRAVLLLLDPYGCKGHLPGLMVGILTHSVYPVYCTCYGLTQVTLIRMSKVDVGHSRLRTLSCLLGCSLTYSFLIVVVETLVFYEQQLKLLMLVDSGYFIVWSTSLAVVFICSGFRLTQYVTDSAGSHKELNPVNNPPDSEANTTGLISIASHETDTAFNEITADLESAIPTPSTTEVLTTNITASDTVQSGSPACHTTGPDCHRPPKSQARHSRSRHKISYQDHVTIAVVTDDDDQSTSSTEVEEPESQKVPKRKRTRKRHRRSRALLRNRSKSETPALPFTCNNSTGKVTANHHIHKQPLPSSNRSQKMDSDKDDENDIPQSTVNPDSQLRNNSQISDISRNNSIISDISRKENKETFDANHATSALPLLSSSHANLSYPDKNNDSEDESNKALVEKSSDHEGNNFHTNFTNGELLHSTSENDPNMGISLSSGASLLLNKNNVKHQRSKTSKGIKNSQEAVSLARPNSHPSHADNEQTRENGYLADTENIVSSPTLAKVSTASHQNTQGPSCEASSRRSSSSSCSYSTSSQRLSETSAAPDASGVTSQRKSKLVLRAVHVTYFLTFLFKFACLLQLYTMFGVYGVLGTIPRPDPWPWFIFQSIFRLTEVSIGLTTTTFAFIALSHRHLRARGREQTGQAQQQQQQHQSEGTGDCIV